MKADPDDPEGPTVKGGECGKTSSSGKPYFVLKAANNQVIGTSKMYSSEAAMENGINSVKSSAPGAVVEEVG